MTSWMHPLQGPNGNPGVDAMATSFAHELNLNEAVTDPEGDAWYFDDNGDENAVSDRTSIGRHHGKDSDWASWKGF